MKYILSTLVLGLVLWASLLIANNTIFADLVNSDPIASTFADGLSTKATLSGDMKLDYENQSVDQTSKGNFFLNNWSSLVFGLLGFLDIVVRLTPTTTDNSVLSVLSKFMDAIIPNRKKGGGSF